MFFAPLELVTKFVTEFTRKDDHFRQLVANTPHQLANRFATIARDHPHLRPGVVQSLGLFGLGTAAPALIAASQRQLSTDAREGVPIQSPYDTTPAQTHSGIIQRTMDRVGDAMGLASGVLPINKDTLRFGLTAAEGLQHEVISKPIIAGADEQRGFVEAYRRLPESPLVHFIHDAFADGIGTANQRLGQGWLPGGSYQERFQEQTHAIKLPSGQHATPGRAILEDIASPGPINPNGVQLVEPGSGPYQLVTGLVDLGLGIALDPAAGLLKSGGAAAKARKTFGASTISQRRRVMESAGVIGSRGIRKTVDPHIAGNEWLKTSRVAQSAIRQLTLEDDFARIWNWLGGSKVPNQIAREIADTKNPDEVLDILSKNIGITMREMPTAPLPSRLGARLIDSPLQAKDPGGSAFGVGPAIRNRLNGRRLGSLLPRQFVDMYDPDDALEQIFRLGRQANMDPSKHMRAMADIPLDEPLRKTKVRNVIEDFHVDLATSLTGNKEASILLAKASSRMWTKFTDDLTNAQLDRGATNLYSDVLNYTYGPRALPPEAHILSEFTDSIPLFTDLQELRHATGTMGQLRDLMNLPGWSSRAGNMMSKFQDSILETTLSAWRKSVLLRPAWFARVGPESWARMAAEGLDSPLNHPAKWLGWSLSMSPSSAPGKAIKRIAGTAGIQPKGGLDPAGEIIENFKSFRDAASSNTSRAWGRVTQNRAIGVNHNVRQFPKGTIPRRQYTRHWAGRLADLHNDPIARHLASHSVEDTMDWLYRGEGRPHLEKLAYDYAEQIDPSTVKSLNDPMKYLSNPRALREYLTGGTNPKTGEHVSGLSDHISEYTRGRQELLDYIIDGELDGVRPAVIGKSTNFHRALNKYYDDGPDTMNGFDEGRHSDLDNSFVDRAFEIIFALPDSHTTRFPGYKQFMWQRTLELAKSSQPALARQLADNARAANLPRSMLKRFDNIAANASPNAVLKDPEVVSAVARRWALENSKKVFFDATERSNAAVNARFVSAFMDAWIEIPKVWSRILRRNPQTIRRAQQVFESARESNPLEIFDPGQSDTEGPQYEDDPSLGAGFFTVNGFGDEVFSYPFSGVALSLLLRQQGLDVPPDQLQMQGRVGGLNIFAGTALPGLGPLGTIAVGEAMPTTSDWDGWRDLLLPFGYEEITNPADKAQEALAPAWFRKGVSAVFGPKQGTNDRTWMSELANSTDFLATNFPLKYTDQNGIVDQSRLLSDAQVLTSQMLLVRMASQATLPTGPMTNYGTRDHSGRLWTLEALGAHFRTRQDEVGISQAQKEIVGLVGPGGLFSTDTIPRTRSVTFRALSKPGAAWERDNPDLVAKYGDVIGLFAPEDDSYDSSAFNRSIASGDRSRLSGEQRAKLHTRTIAFLTLDRAEEEVRRAGHDPTRDQGRQYMSDVRDYLDATYPGWENTGIPDRDTPEVSIAKLTEAIKNPILAATPQGEALAAYLAARNEVQAEVTAQADTETYNGSKGWQQSNTTAPLRQYLRDTAEHLIETYPEFEQVWRYVLRREGKLDDPAEIASFSPPIPPHDPNDQMPQPPLDPELNGVLYGAGELDQSFPIDPSSIMGPQPIDSPIIGQDPDQSQAPTQPAIIQ